MHRKEIKQRKREDGYGGGRLSDKQRKKAFLVAGLIMAGIVVMIYFMRGGRLF